MKTIIYKQFIYSLLFLTAFLLPVACDDWNEPEIVDIDINSAKEQNPELWARYMQALPTNKVNITCHMRTLIILRKNR